MTSTSFNTALAVLVAAATYYITARIFSRKQHWDPRSRHCYITGGSSGLGLSLAILLTQSGADVSIIARNKERLAKALEELEKARQTPNQLLFAYSYDVGKDADAAEALREACKPHEGRSPDAVFLCAGKSTPGFFLEESPDSLRKGMDNAYWVSAYSALATAKFMVQSRMKGKIVFVSSILGYMSVIGYSSYSPAKWALRGLAETLRSEFGLYGIETHIFFPPTIFTPGYEEENKTKPKITLKIEESDDGVSPEKAAIGLLRGVQKGHFHITADILSDLFRCSTRGATPCNNNILDPIYSVIGWVGITIWRRSVDSTVRAHAREHQEYLEQRGWGNTDTS